MQELKIDTDFIKLGQALKLAAIVTSGVEAKFMIQEEQVMVNDEVDARRGRKLYEGDVVSVEGYESFKIVK
ncbi:RNA-binding S4 domain-containing protein [Vallitalea okinawensis]|uniref:RNA-binding S4 domain-containing protein n=1 Tax=Vallitalea okinawensis TaxID=2078660 RepID=UPI000CFDB0C6|nr:RNA-binding S4 domain-containing protein [Vallitalea okinawensis]